MAEGTHLHVGLLKAWELWLQGKDIKGDGDVLWGLGLIWWSRIGVITGFLGGLVIVLDIVGEERLHRYGIAQQRRMSGNGGWVVSGIAGTVGGYLGHAAAHSMADPARTYVAVGAAMFAALSVSAVIFVLSEGKAATYGRIYALVMLVVSAHFTLLTG